MSRNLPENTDDWTMAEHAEVWWTEKGNTVPPKDSPEYEEMYADWHEYAFENFPESPVSLNDR